MSIDDLKADIEEEKKAKREADRISQNNRRAKWTQEQWDAHYTKMKAYVEKNKDKIKAARRMVRQVNKDKAIAYLGGKCVKCEGVFHRAAFDFHHRDGETKDNTVGAMFHNDWEIIRVELDKCVLLCSNCHRVEHYDGA
jgi:hypothetical protein